jgi:hypothetical protein
VALKVSASPVSNVNFSGEVATGTSVQPVGTELLVVVSVSNPDEQAARRVEPKRSRARG